jgi:hypothetical protein
MTCEVGQSAAAGSHRSNVAGVSGALAVKSNGVPLSEVSFLMIVIEPGGTIVPPLFWIWLSRLPMAELRSQPIRRWWNDAPAA